MRGHQLGLADGSVRVQEEKRRYLHHELEGDLANVKPDAGTDPVLSRVRYSLQPSEDSFFMFYLSKHN